MFFPTSDNHDHDDKSNTTTTTTTTTTKKQPTNNQPINNKQPTTTNQQQPTNNDQPTTTLLSHQHVLQSNSKTKDLPAASTIDQCVFVGFDHWCGLDMQNLPLEMFPITSSTVENEDKIQLPRTAVWIVVYSLEDGSHF